jgi:hypothetical protein
MRTTIRTALAAAPLVALVLAVPAAAQLAMPSVQTNGATKITITSAQLNGSVNPRGSATTYHFDYGTTTAYGSQTPAKSAGSGTKAVPVNASVSLSPGTKYHFRVTADNLIGTRSGTDHTFTTPKEPPPPPTPPSISLAGPNVPIVYGQPAAFSGQVTGTGTAGAKVTLQSTPFPFTAPFGNLQGPVAVDAPGHFQFTVSPMVAATRFQAVAATKPAVTSAVITVQVSVIATLHASHTTVRRGRSVLFTGSVRPGHDGSTVELQRGGRKGGWVTVSRVPLTHASAKRSAFKVRLTPAATRSYRAVPLITDGDHVAAATQPVLIRVRG